MRIPDAEAVAVIREQIKSRGWYLIVTDDEDTSLALACQMFMVELSGRVAGDDFAAAVVDFVTPAGMKAVVTYLGLKKSAFSRVFFRNLVRTVDKNFDVTDDENKDSAVISADGAKSAAFCFIASVESGKIRSQRTDGMN